MGYMPVSFPRALPGTGPEPVARILYASQSRINGPVYAQMERIRACAVRHNEPLGVYTALAHQSGWFLQWKEGPADAVRQIMERVLQDPRHHGARIMHRSTGPRLLPDVWSMSIVQCNDSAAEFEARVDQVDAVRCPAAGCLRSTGAGPRVWPQKAMVRSSSLWMISSALVTPASPIAPRP
jgi:hypothetical protein